MSSLILVDMQNQTQKTLASLNLNLILNGQQNTSLKFEPK